MVTKTPTSGMNRSEWLAARHTGIGGSDAAVILGLNPYKGLYTLWAEKTGLMAENDISGVEAVRIGTDLEDYVAKRFCEATGKRVRRENAILRNSDMPWALANVDRMIVGENAGLECKTTSAFHTKRFTVGEYPPVYYAQCQHYMMVTGRPIWYLAVLVLGKEFLWCQVPRCDDDIAALARTEQDFWQMVIDKTPPAPDGSGGDSETINAAYPEDNDLELDLTGSERLVREYLAAAEQADVAAKVKDALKQEICLKLGDYSVGRVGEYRVSWKQQTRSTFDVKAFAKGNPGIDLSDYYKASSSRVFRVGK